MSYELFLTNFLAESHAARKDAAQLRGAAGDRLRRGDDLRYLSRVSWFLGRGSDAWTHAHTAVRMLEPLGPGRELAMAWGNLSHLYMLDRQVEPAVNWGRRSLELGRTLDDPEVVAYALNNIGSAELAADVDEGRNKLLESLRIARDGDMQEHVDRALINLGEAELGQRRYDSAERYLTECLDFTVACDLERCMLVVNAWRALARLEMGRWAEAQEIARVAVDHPRLAPPGRIVALCVLSRLAFRQGNADAWQLATQAGQLADESGDMAMLAMVAASVAEGAWLAGDNERARDAVERAYPLAIARNDVWTIGELAAWRWRAGGSGDVPASVAEPYRLALGGQWAAAAEAWRRLGNPYEESLALSQVTEISRVQSAFVKLVELGAPATAHVVGRRIRELGGTIPRGPRMSTRANPALLTDRESEVAALVAEGLSNREISDRLVLSEKTVGHHVSAVLGKLGVRRRGEVARALAGAGLLAT